MSTLIRLDTMRNRAREHANMEGNGVFITNASINDEVNSQLAELYDELRAAYGDEYFQKTQAVTTVSATENYALNADFLSAQRVEVKPSGSADVYPLDAYMPAEAAYLRTLGTRYSFQAPYKYRVVAANINFLPVPSATDNITIYYTPTFTPLVADSDTFDSINYWENFAVWGVVAYMLAKDDADPSFALGEKEKLRARIRALAPMRDAGTPQRIADVEQRWGRFGGLQ